jgi:hypothetical protein
MDAYVARRSEPSPRLRRTVKGRSVGTDQSNPCNQVAFTTDSRQVKSNKSSESL